MAWRRAASAEGGYSAGASPVGSASGATAIGRRPGIQARGSTEESSAPSISESSGSAEIESPFMSSEVISRPGPITRGDFAIRRFEDGLVATASSIGGTPPGR